MTPKQLEYYFKCFFEFYEKDRKNGKNEFDKNIDIKMFE